MTFICPQCLHSTSALNMAAGLVNCEHCKEWFQAPSAPAIKIPPQVTVDASRESIRRQANWFSLVAALCAALGIFFLILGISKSFSDEASGGTLFFILMSGCFGSALWLYLIAQIIHIRANTEK